MFIQAYKEALAVIAKKPIMLWGLSLLSGVMIVLASIFTAPIFILGIVFSILITCGMAKVYIDGLAGKQVNSDQLFAAFNKNCIRIVGGMAWQALWIIIWALVPIVGPVLAVIKAYSYRFVPYILMTKPEVTATQALRLSMEMTKGKKMQMFLADLCFGGGIFVVFFVLGLLCAIPVVGILFMLIAIVASIAVALFSSIFQGLYQTYFYMQAAATETQSQPACAETV